MIIDGPMLCRFAEKIPALIANYPIKIEKVTFPGRSETNWDSPARQKMKELFCCWLRNEFEIATESEIEKILFVEGLLGRLPKENKGDFFGSVCCPDMALQSIGYTVAIELDHGASGASLRNALTKAIFNVIVGGFDLSIVLFFVEACNKDKFYPDHKILELFNDRFSTSVIFVENYQPL